MWTRQVDTLDQALKDIAKHRAAGSKTTDPIKTKGPSGKTVWMYGVFF
jgi:hypothetical protein